MKSVTVSFEYKTYIYMRPIRVQLLCTIQIQFCVAPKSKCREYSEILQSINDVLCEDCATGVPAVGDSN